VRNLTTEVLSPQIMMLKFILFGCTVRVANLFFLKPDFEILFF